MNKKIEIAFFATVLALLVVFLIQPERRCLAFLYSQKAFLYLNIKNSEVIYAKDFKYNSEVEPYGVNLILEPGDSGCVSLDLEQGKYVLLFSVKKAIGAGENPKFISFFDNDTIANQEIWSEEWMYVRSNFEISEKTKKVMTIFSRKENHSLNLILSKVYVVKK